MIAMPFKSKAQRRKFAELLVEGKISNETFEEWNRETGRKQLPERVNRKASSRRKGSTKRKRTAKRKRPPRGKRAAKRKSARPKRS